MKIVDLTQSRSQAIIQAIDYHKKTNTPLLECVFRYGSEGWFEFFTTARSQVNEGLLHVALAQDHEVVSGDLGTFADYKGMMVPLDHIFEDEDLNEAEYQGKTVQLNQPKRGGSGGKKFHVFVKNPKTGNVKKISFGDASGLSVKIRDPKRRKSFAARHDCEHKTDKMTAGYWACRLPAYTKSLGLAPVGARFW
jgi:hypothetical protein